MPIVIFAFMDVLFVMRIVSLPDTFIIRLISKTLHAPFGVFN